MATAEEIAQRDAEDSIEQVISRYTTDLQSGLTTASAEHKLKEDGLNELYKPPKPTLLMLFIMQLLGFIIILLIIAAVASMTVNATGSKRDDPLSYTTGIAIFVIVILNAGIAAWTEHKAGDALEALSKMTQAAIYVSETGRKFRSPPTRWSAATSSSWALVMWSERTCAWQRRKI